MGFGNNATGTVKITGTFPHSICFQREPHADVKADSIPDIAGKKFQQSFCDTYEELNKKSSGCEPLQKKIFSDPVTLFF
jgi:hypothetical protein